MHLLEEFELHSLINLELFGVDLSINKAVIAMWIASFLVFLLLYLAARRKELVPRGLQNVMETLVQFLREEVVIGMMGKEGLPWFPFIATLFFFILGCNLIGLIPGSFTPTSNIFVTATLAMVVFISVQLAGIYKHGLLGHIGGWIPRGVPVAVAIIMFPIEVISQIAKPFSLAVRLFANMLAGHLVIISLLGLIFLFKSYLIAVFPVLGAVAIFMLEIGFSLIQAYIFTVLSAMYIADAIHGAH